MVSPLHMVFFLIGLAFIFDVFNGFHDAANSVATVVTTRVLSPIQAVFWAAFFNFVAAFLFGTGVAKTISDKLIDPKVVDLYVIFGGLVGAIRGDTLVGRFSVEGPATVVSEERGSWRAVRVMP